MKIKYLTLSVLAMLFLLTLSHPAVASNANAITNCDSPDNVLDVHVSDEFKFVINGMDNPDVTVPTGSCLGITIESTASVTHDFTVEVSGAQIIHLLAGPSETVNASFSIPSTASNTKYFCSQTGHRANGMEGNFDMVAGGTYTVAAAAKKSSSPGFGLPLAFIGLVTIALVLPKIRKNIKQ